MDIGLLIIGISFFIIIILVIYVNYKPFVTYDNGELKWISCKELKFDEEGKLGTHINENCIMECEEQGEFEFRDIIFHEVQEGEETLERNIINSDGEIIGTQSYTVPRMVTTSEEIVTTRTYPPCDRFCDTCGFYELN
jgi:hypothetical protein